MSQLELCREKPVVVPAHKAAFLVWLGRFSYVRRIRILVEQGVFTADELERLKIRVLARYSYKKKFAKLQGS